MLINFTSLVTSKLLIVLPIGIAGIHFLMLDKIVVLDHALAHEFQVTKVLCSKQLQQIKNKIQNNTNLIAKDL